MSCGCRYCPLSHLISSKAGLFLVVAPIFEDHNVSQPCALMTKGGPCEGEGWLVPFAVNPCSFRNNSFFFTHHTRTLLEEESKCLVQSLFIHLHHHHKVVRVSSLSVAFSRSLNEDLFSGVRVDHLMHNTQECAPFCEPWALC